MSTYLERVGPEWLVKQKHGRQNWRERRAVIEQMFKDGKNNREIAEAMNSTPQRISTILHKMGYSQMVCRNCGHPVRTRRDNDE